MRGDEPVSFTLDPNFTGKSLPWLDRTGSEELQAYTVNKKDILAAPNAVLRSGMGTDTEYEVVIPGSRVFSVGDEPRPTDPSVLEKGLMADDDPQSSVVPFSGGKETDEQKYTRAFHQQTQEKKEEIVQKMIDEGKSDLDILNTFYGTNTELIDKVLEHLTNKYLTPEKEPDPFDPA